MHEEGDDVAAVSALSPHFSAIVSSGCMNIDACGAIFPSPRATEGCSMTGRLDESYKHAMKN